MAEFGCSPSAVKAKYSLVASRSLLKKRGEKLFFQEWIKAESVLVLRWEADRVGDRWEADRVGDSMLTMLVPSQHGGDRLATERWSSGSYHHPPLPTPDGASQIRQSLQPG